MLSKIEGLLNLVFFSSLNVVMNILKRYGMDRDRTLKDLLGFSDEGC